MPVAQEDPSTTQLPSTNRHPVFFTITTTTTSPTTSYVALASAAAPEAGGPEGAPAAAPREAGGGRGGPAAASTEVAIADPLVNTHKQLSHSHLGRVAPFLLDQGHGMRDSRFLYRTCCGFVICGHIADLLIGKMAVFRLQKVCN